MPTRVKVTDCATTQTQVIFATLHAEDDKVYKKCGKARFAQEDSALQYMSRMDYTKFLETALDDSQKALTSSPSFSIQDMRRACVAHGYAA